MRNLYRVVEMLCNQGRPLHASGQEYVSVNPLKAEFYLPTVANNQLAANRATVRVLHTDESWHGVTYREDLASVQESVAAMHAAGIYPPVLFE